MVQTSVVSPDLNSDATKPPTRTRTCVAPPPTPQTELNHDGVELEGKAWTPSMMRELISRLLKENQRLHQQLANDNHFVMTSFRRISLDMTCSELEAEEYGTNTGYLEPDADTANSAPESDALQADTRSELLSFSLENIPEHPLPASDQNAYSSENVIYNPSSDDPESPKVQSITVEDAASPNPAIDTVDRQLESLSLDEITTGSPDSTTRDTLAKPDIQLPAVIKQTEQMDEENTPDSSNAQPTESAPEQPNVPSTLCQKLRLMIFETVGCQCRLCLLSSKDNFENDDSLEVLQRRYARNHTEEIANLLNRLVRAEATRDRV